MFWQAGECREASATDKRLPGVRGISMTYRMFWEARECREASARLYVRDYSATEISGCGVLILFLPHALFSEIASLASLASQVTSKVECFQRVAFSACFQPLKNLASLASLASQTGVCHAEG